MVIRYFSLSRSSFRLFKIFLRKLPRSTKDASPSTPIAAPLVLLIFELQLDDLPCEGALERSDPSRDSASGWSFCEDSPLSRVSSAKNFLSRGSTFFSSIYTSPLISENFMFKEIMSMSSIKCFWLDTKEQKWYGIKEGDCA